MGIWDRSIMRGRRILPNVAEPVTSFGNAFKLDWKIAALFGSSNLYLQQTDAWGLIALSMSTGIFGIDPATGAPLKTYLSGTNYVAEVAEDPDGNVYFVAYYGEAKKFDATGTLLLDKKPGNVGRFSNGAVWADGFWVSTYAVEAFGAVSSTLNFLWSQGGVYAVQYQNGVICVSDGQTIRGLDLNGAEIWSRTSSGLTTSNIYRILGSYDGVFYAVVNDGNAGVGWSIAAIDAAGNDIWKSDEVCSFVPSTQSRASENCSSIAVDKFGDVYALLGRRPYDLVKFSKDGEFMGSATLSGVIPLDQTLNGTVNATNVEVDADGGVYIGFQNGDVIKLIQTNPH